MHCVSHTERANNAKELSILYPKEKPTKDPDLLPSSMKLHSGKNVNMAKDNKAKLQIFTKFTEELFNTMKADVRSKNPLPLQWPVNKNKHSICLVLSTSWPWHSLPSNSRLCEIHNIAGAAALEQGIINEYRPFLLVEGSGALWLRATLIKKLSNCLKVSYFPSKNLVKWCKDTTFIFPDMLDISTAPEEDQFPIARMFAQLQSELSQQSDALSLQNIVKVVECCPLSWKDPSNEDGFKSPPLNPEVHHALEVLVHAHTSSLIFSFTWCPDLLCVAGSRSYISNLHMPLPGLTCTFMALCQQLFPLKHKVVQVTQGHSFSWIWLVLYFYCTYCTCNQCPNGKKWHKIGTNHPLNILCFLHFSHLGWNIAMGKSRNSSTECAMPSIGKK